MDIEILVFWDPTSRNHIHGFFTINVEAGLSPEILVPMYEPTGQSYPRIFIALNKWSGHSGQQISRRLLPFDLLDLDDVSSYWWIEAVGGKYCHLFRVDQTTHYHTTGATA